MGGLMGEIFYSVQGEKKNVEIILLYVRATESKFDLEIVLTEQSHGCLESIILVKVTHYWRKNSCSPWTNRHSKHVIVRKTLTSPRCTRLTPRRGTLGTTQTTKNTSGRGRAGRRGPASRAPVRDSTDGHRQGEKQRVTVNRDGVFWEAHLDFGLLPRYPVEGC